MYSSASKCSTCLTMSQWSRPLKTACHPMGCPLINSVKFSSPSCTSSTRRTRVTRIGKSKKWAENTVRIGRGRHAFWQSESSSWIRKCRLKLLETTIRWGRHFWHLIETLTALWPLRTSCTISAQILLSMRIFRSSCRSRIGTIKVA